jgi:hypothetical protein
METVADPRQKRLDELQNRIKTLAAAAEKATPDINNKTNEPSGKPEIPPMSNQSDMGQSIDGIVLAFYTVAKTRLVKNEDEANQRKAKGESYITKSQFKDLVKVTNAYRKVADGLDSVLQDAWLKHLNDAAGIGADGKSSDAKIAKCQSDLENCNSGGGDGAVCQANYFACLETYFEENLAADVAALENEES